MYHVTGVRMRYVGFMGLAVLAAAGTGAFGDTPAVWDGSPNNWSSALHWSSNPNVPNNGTPPGSLYDVTVTSGTVTLDINPTIQVFTFTGGLLNGAGNLTVLGSMNWSNSATLGGSGNITTTDLTMTTYANMSGTGSLTSTGANSTWNAPGGYIVTLAAGNTYTNQGTLTINTASSPLWTGGTFNNSGSSALVTAGAPTINSMFNNTGSVSASNGTLSLSGGGTDTGNYSTSGAGNISLTGGTRVFNAGASVSSGTLTVNGGALTLNSAVPSSISNLNLMSGTINGTGNATVAGTLSWSGAGPGISTIGGSAAISAGNVAITTYVTMNGTSSLTATGANSSWNAPGGYTVTLAAGNMFTNQGTLTINTTSSPSWNGGTFNNSGSLALATAGLPTISSTFNNSGSVSASNGTLSLSGNGTDTGSYSTSGSGVVSLTGGTRVFNTGASVSSGTLTVNGGTLSFNSATPNSISNLSFISGTINGTGNATLVGTLSWGNSGSPAGATIGGNVSISGGNVAITTYAAMNGTSSVTATGANSSWNPTGGYIVTMALGNTFANQGTMTINTGSSPQWNGGTFNNSGTLNNVGAGNALISSTFNNSGAVSASNGTLSLSGNGTDTGSYSTSGAGIVSLTGGTRVFTTGASVSGGTLTVNGGTLSLNSATPNSISNLSFIGGMINGTGNATVTGTLTWGNSGSLSGATIGGNVSFSGGNVAITTYAAMNGTSSVTATGANSSWNPTGAYIVTLAAGNTFTNQGTLTINTASSPQWNGGTFNNSGTLTNVGAGISLISSTFNNSGAVSAANGTLSLGGGGTDTGSYSTSGTGVVSLTGGTRVFNTGASVSSGTLTLNGATLTLNSATPNSISNMNFLGGTINGTGNATVAGIFSWGNSGSLSGATIGGSASITGGIAITTYAAMTGTSSVTATGANSSWNPTGAYIVTLAAGNTFTNQGTLTINTASNPQWNGGTFNNSGSLVQTGAGGPSISSVFENSGSVTVTHGVLSLTGGDGGATTGTFSVGSGATLNLSGGYTLSGAANFSGAGTMNFNAGTNKTFTGVNVAAVTIAGSTSLQVTTNGAASGTSKMTSLTIAGGTNGWTGKLDLTNNRMVLEPNPAASHATALANAQNQVGYGNALGGGIFSTTLPANMGMAVVDNGALFAPLATFGGVAVDANSILVGEELLGDANIDGRVDLTDLSTVLNNFGSTTPAWTSGNFDGATKIDLTDLSDVLNDFGQTDPNASVVAGAGGAVAAAAPEPMSLAVLGAGAVALAGRRRKG